MQRLLHHKSTTVAFAAFIAGAFLVFGRALGFDFVSLDDSSLVYLNPAVRHLSLPNIFRIFSTYDPELYIPLTLFSFQLDHAVGGGSPSMFHATSIFLHGCNAFLAWLLAQKLTRSAIAAAVTGGLFLLHPINVEAAMWISGRKDLLSALFVFLSLLLWLQFSMKGERRSYFGSIAAYAAALLSKVNVLLTPLLLPLLDERIGKKQVRSIYGPFAVLSVLFALIALGGKSDLLGESSVSGKILLAIRGIPFALYKILWPVDLSVAYPYDGPVSWMGASFLLSLAIVIALIAIAVFLRKRTHEPFFALTWFLVFLLPSLGNLVKGEAIVLGSDRYVYMASFGLFFLTGIAVDRIARYRKTPVIVALVAFFAFLAFLSHRQSLVWRDNLTLYRHVLALEPAYANGYISLGNALAADGQTDAAMEAFVKSMELRPSAQAAYNMGLAKERAGDVLGALREYQRTLELEPDYVFAYINVGRIQYAAGNDDAAATAFVRALEQKPDFAMAHFNIGVMLDESGALDEAEMRYRSAIESDDQFIDAYINLAALLLKRGNTESSIVLFRRAAGIDPAHPQVRSFGTVLREQGLF